MKAQYIAFHGHKRVAAGPLEETLAQVKRHIDQGTNPAAILIFELASGRQRDFDFRGSLKDVLDRAGESAQRGRGRPKLGVTSKEVTLLPRHWAWLANQGKSPSATLRTLVEEAMRRDPRAHTGQTDAEALWRILSAVAGNLPGLEEVSRSLFRGDAAALAELVAEWPQDLRDLVVG